MHHILPINLGSMQNNIPAEGEGFPYQPVQRNLHRHTWFDYGNFHPLTAQVNWHYSYGGWEDQKEQKGMRKENGATNAKTYKACASECIMGYFIGNTLPYGEDSREV